MLKLSFVVCVLVLFDWLLWRELELLGGWGWVEDNEEEVVRRIECWGSFVLEVFGDCGCYGFVFCVFFVGKFGVCLFVFFVYWV